MVLLLSLATAAFIVCGQALWKLAVTRAAELGLGFTSVENIIKILLSWPLIVGVLVYGVATVAYIYLLSKYNYYQVQAVVVGGSLILTAVVAKLFFNEPISMLGYLGIACIFIGALLVTR